MFGPVSGRVRQVGRVNRECTREGGPLIATIFVTD